jgi:hypothetical protein
MHPKKSSRLIKNAGTEIFSAPIELIEQALKNYRDFGWQFLILSPLPQR